MNWSNQDPREVIDGFTQIVIYSNDGHVFTGYVFTKESWYIQIDSPENCRNNMLYMDITANFKWPEHWQWIRLP